MDPGHSLRWFNHLPKTLAMLEQFLVRTGCFYTPLYEQVQPVTTFDCAEPVSNND